MFPYHLAILFINSVYRTVRSGYINNISRPYRTGFNRSGRLTAIRTGINQSIPHRTSPFFFQCLTIQGYQPFLSRRITMSVLSWSRSPVGSSAMSKLGWFISARAMETRRISPPDSSRG